jgi:hypothetical protein
VVAVDCVAAAALVVAVTHRVVLPLLWRLLQPLAVLRMVRILHPVAVAHIVAAAVAVPITKVVAVVARADQTRVAAAALTKRAAPLTRGAPLTHVAAHISSPTNRGVTPVPARVA